MAKSSPFAAVILAAGKGTRMKSNLPKVMHKIAGKPMIQHVVGTVGSLSPKAMVTVIAPDLMSVKDAAQAENADCRIAFQDKQLGTGHAVRAAEKALKSHTGPVLILYGDTPLLTPKLLRRMLAELAGPKKPSVVVLGMRPADAAEYGRLIVNAKGQLERIVEYVDASAAERNVNLVNSGVLAVDGKWLFKLLAKVKNNNAKKEYYITDIIPLARAQKLTCRVIEAEDVREVLGVNSRAQLADAERVMQDRLRAAAMGNGATLIDPASVYFSHDTKLGRDVTVHPNVFFGPSVTIGNGVEVRSFSHIEGAKVKDGCVIGPFARLRPGAVLATNVHIGNFVEVKKARIGEGAKINHLSYIGDAFVGKEANIGAGTITCNYDGHEKHETHIGERAFIGSNTALVAPVSIGKGAVVAAGSVITSDVVANSLAIARARQTLKEGWATGFNKRKK